MQESIFSVGTSQRADAMEQVDCTRFAGKAVEAYIGFLSIDGKFAATSIYAGTLTL